MLILAVGCGRVGYDDGEFTDSVDGSLEEVTNACGLVNVSPATGGASSVKDELQAGPFEPMCGAGSRDALAIELSVTTRGTFAIEGSAQSFDAILGLFEGPCDSLDYVACVSTSLPKESILMTLDPNTYVVVVQAVDYQGGDGEILVERR